MKATTQYNDYLGTSAADMSDYTTLSDYLESKGVDTNRYYPIGVNFYCGYSDFFDVKFICKDTSTSDKKAVTIGFEEEISKDEFFNLFKRLNVIFTFAKGKNDFANWELEDNSIMYDNRPQAD